MKLPDFMVPARNFQEKTGGYLILAAQIFCIIDATSSIMSEEPKEIVIFSPLIIVALLLVLIGLGLIYESKKRNKTLSDLNSFFKSLPYIGGIGLLIGVAIFAFYYFK